MTRSYENKKKKLRKLVNGFDLFDNLIHLADANELSKDILKKEEFPSKLYARNKKKQNKKNK